MARDGLAVSWTPPEGTLDPVEYAVSLLQRGQAPLAVPMLRGLVADRPDDLVVLYNLGMAESDLGRLDEAVSHLSALLEREPAHVNGRVALGVAHARAGRIEEAIATLKRAVEAAPENPWARRNLAALLGKAGRQEEAASHLREAVRLLPGDQQSLYGLAHTLVALGGADRDLALIERARVRGREIVAIGGNVQAVGAAAGAVNGFFIARFKLQSFIVTLATMGAIRGLVFVYSDIPITPDDPAFRAILGAGRIGPFPVSALIMLAAHGWVPAWVVCVIIGRELTVTGLRSVIAGKGADVSASHLGKLKTGFQVAAIIPLMIHYPLFGLDCHAIGMVFLWLALGFTAWSAVDYFIKFKKVL